MYLEKENKDPDRQHTEYFFDQDRTDITPDEVSDRIDQNTTGLKKREPKFYLITVQPSDRELGHIASDKDKLRLYIRELMKDYAKSFNREIFSRSVQVRDILYFAKIEVSPKYNYRDQEVKQNAPYLKEIKKLDQKIRSTDNQKDVDLLQTKVVSLFKKTPHKIRGVPIQRGMDKPGRRTHVHLIVSRKDATNSHSLSPGSAYRASDVVLNGKLIKRGFHRTRFYEAAEKRFDQLFSFKRNYADSFAARNLYLKDPKEFFSQLNALPPAEKKKAYSFLRRAHVPTLDISRAQLALALKNIRKALDKGMECSSVEY